MKKNDCDEKKKKNILTEESPFLLNALFIPFFKKAEGDY